MYCYTSNKNTLIPIASALLHQFKNALLHRQPMQCYTSNKCTVTSATNALLHEKPMQCYTSNQCMATKVTNTMVTQITNAWLQQ